MKKHQDYLDMLEDIYHRHEVGPIPEEMYFDFARFLDEVLSDAEEGTVGPSTWFDSEAQHALEGEK